jgi:hypothetical protein
VQPLSPPVLFLSPPIKRRALSGASAAPLLTLTTLLSLLVQRKRASPNASAFPPLTTRTSAAPAAAASSSSSSLIANSRTKRHSSLCSPSTRELKALLDAFLRGVPCTHAISTLFLEDAKRARSQLDLFDPSYVGWGQWEPLLRDLLDPAGPLQRADNSSSRAQADSAANDVLALVPHLGSLIRAQMTNQEKGLASTWRDEILRDMISARSPRADAVLALPSRAVCYPAPLAAGAEEMSVQTQASGSACQSRSASSECG